MDNDVLTRNENGELSVRTVSATEQANVVNPDDVYTRTTEGYLAVRTVGNGGGGGGAVDSVNGKTGVVVLDAEDVGALANTTKYVVNASWTIDPSTYVMTLQLKDQDGANIGTAQTIDLPLESVVVGGSYDSTNKNIVLTLNNGTTINVPVADLVSGLQSEITAQDPLSADLVDDTNTTHKFVSAAEKSTWNNKQDAISDLATIRSGAAAGATAIQSVKTINNQSIVGEGNITLTAADVDAIPQVANLPVASASYENAIIQSRSDGYFYKCVSDGQSPATYSWIRVDTQPAGAQINDSSTSLTETWSASKLNTMIGDVETLLSQI